MVEKAGVFEVALPSVAGISSGGAAEEEDEAAGVGLAFYAAVFVLKVWLAQYCERTSRSHHRRLSPTAVVRCSAGVQDEEPEPGTRR